MPESNYWTRARRVTIGRRRVLSSGIGIAALAAAGCSTQSKPQGASPSGSQAGAQETPKTGGTFNGTIPFNTPLDPQKVSAQPQRTVAGVYSRLFRFQDRAPTQRSSATTISRPISG